jgi:Flp pilus assembly protein TadG
MHGHTSKFATVVMTLFRSHIFRAFRRFRREKKGNVALIFAIAVIPVLGCVGAAIDFSNANSVKAAMQAALDSTALMLSKDAASYTEDQLQNAAQDYFDALFNRPEAQNVTVTASYTTGGGSAMQVTASADVPTTFMSIFGFNQIPVTDSSTAKWGSSRLRVALALDNTGSMNDDGKLAALKTATKNLLNQLQDAASDDGDVYVSIVPFVKDVNLGASNYTSSWDNWLDWSLTEPSNTTPNSSVGPGSLCPYSSGWGGNGYDCVTQPGGSNTTATIPSSGGNKGYICPSNSIGCYDSVGTTTTATITVGTGRRASCRGYSNCSCSGSRSYKVCTQVVTTATYTHKWFVDPSKWSGCVTDRGDDSGPISDYDRLATAPSSSIVASMFPAEEYSSCPQPIMGLSYDWTGMASLVDSMTASGGTNQPIGLVWAWQTLAGGGPFDVPAFDSNYKYQQVIILLSDGLNTQDRWYGNGSSTSTSVDHRMYDTDGDGTCANIKDAGITIYTIQVNTGGDPTSTLLQNCASNTAGTTDHFFLLTSADQLVTTFQTIGTNLTKLRVAQ